MNLLDMRTIIFSYLITDIICVWFIVLLWRQNRNRYTGMAFWVVDFVLQTAALALIVLRGTIPDWISMILSNTMVIGGAILGFVGLERFVGKRGPQIHNCLLLTLFIFIQSYFALVQPNLAARILNISVALFLVCVQSVWLLWRRVEPGMRSLTFGAGMVNFLYCMVSLARIAQFFTTTHAENNFMRSGHFEVLMFLSYQMLFVLLTYSFVMMVNKRLIMGISMQEEKFFKAFHSAPYVVMLTRLSDGMIIDVNESIVSITGYDRAEVIGKNKTSLQLWEHQEDCAAVVDTLSRSGKTQGIELQFRKKTGESVTGLFSTEIIEIEGEKIVLSSISDITERKQAEEALRESEERYRTQFEEALDGICLADAEAGIIIDCNQSLWALVGRDRAEVIGQPQTILHPPTDDNTAFSPTFKQHLTNKMGQVLEAQVVSKTGEIREVEIKANQMNLQGRKVLQGIFRDITERKRTEEKLRESEERAHSLFIEAPVGYFEYDARGHITNVNQTELEMLGYSLEEMMGQPVWSFIVNGEVARNQILAKLAGTMPPARGLERIYKRKDGTTIPVLIEDRIHRNKEGRIIGIRSTIQDITEQKRMEEILQESEEKYRTLFEGSRDAVYITSKEGKFINLNQAFVDLFGYSIEDLKVVKASETYVNPADRDKFRQEIERKGFVRDFEVKLRKKDGTEIDCLITSTVRRANDGSILGYQGSIRDITRRKRAGEVLRKSEMDLKEAQRVGHLGSWDLNVVTGDLQWSDECYRIYGLRPQEFVPTYEKFRSIIHPKDLGFVQEQVDAALNNDKHYDVDFRFVRPNGEIGWIHCEGEVTRDAEGKPIRFFGTQIDITERKRAEEERRNLETKLQRAQKMEALGLMAGGVAHDLNNMLTAIVSLPELILMDIPKEDQKLRRRMQMIMSSGEKISTIVNDLLTITRGVTMTQDALNLNKIVQEYMRSPEFEKLKQFHPKVEVVTELADDLLPIRGERVHLMKTLMNLVSNASEAIRTSDSGVVSVSTQNRYVDAPLEGYERVNIGEYAVLVVKDNGMGISPQDMERIFEPFYTKKVMGRSGTGLGPRLSGTRLPTMVGISMLKAVTAALYLSFTFRLPERGFLSRKNP